MAKHACNFEIVIWPDSDGNYGAFAHCPDLAGEVGPLRIPKSHIVNLTLMGQQLANGGLRSRAQAASIGHQLYQTIFDGALGELFQKARVISEREAGILRLLLKFQQSIELHEIPWELLHDGKSFLALTPNTPVVRYLMQAEPVKSPVSKPPLRILFTTACPVDQRPLDLETEEHHVRSALAPLRGSVELAVERRISLDRLQRVLAAAEYREEPFHVWHHCGHGGLFTQDSTSVFALVLEREGSSQIVDIEQMSTATRAYPSLQAVILNVCHGASSVGLAVALALMRMPIAIGFRNSILDQTALTFAKVFYEAASYAPIDVALGYARSALATRPDQPLDWAMPIMFLRSADPILLAVPAQPSTAAIEIPELHLPHTPNTPTIRVKGKKVSARQVINWGGAAQSTTENYNVELEVDELNADQILQIAGLSLSSEEASEQFETIRKMLGALSSSDLD